jgi:DNA-binding MarR family transcriptional regulator
MADGREMDRRREQVLLALKAYTLVQKEFGQVFARSRGMHTTDAAAIVEILTAERRGAPLTPARLAELITLTPAATSTLLNRLEEAGDVVRRRGHKDRRVVTLHGTSRIQEKADSFYAPLNASLDDVMGQYSAEELDLVEKFVDDLSAVISGAFDDAR